MHASQSKRQSLDSGLGPVGHVSLETEELRCRDKAMGVAYPTASAKKVQWSKSRILHEVQYTLLTLYALVAFTGFFFF